MKLPRSNKEEKVFQIDQVAVRLVKTDELTYHEPLTCPENVVKAMSEIMSQFDREVVGIINLKADMVPINIHFASVGIVNEAMAHPREIFKTAILSNAASMLLLHNHPSGRLFPSEEDTMMTDRMLKASRIMGIPLVDHIIVGGDSTRYFSFKERQVLSMEGLKLEKDYRNIRFQNVAEHNCYRVKESGNPYESKKGGKDPMSDQKRESSVKEITKKLEQGLKELFESERYKTYLTTMSKFHNYSFNNTLLIAMQKPDATLVAGFTSWQKNFDRHVKKGEKGIRIMAPAPYKKKTEQEVIDPNTQKPIRGEDGKVKKKQVEIIIPAFKPVTVFDVSQTDGKPIPELAINELLSKVEDYQDFVKALAKVAPVPVMYEDIPSGAKGYFSPSQQKIAIQKGMSESQTVKTLIHETAHSLLHDKENVRMEGTGDAEKKSRSTKEVEAESVAYTVCQHFGIDTSEYSFGYVAGWSSGKEMPELKTSMETIRKTASRLITDTENALKEIRLTKTLENEKEGKASLEDALKLAEKIDGFIYSYDKEVYQKQVPDRNAHIKGIAEDLHKNEYGYLTDYLKAVLKDQRNAPFFSSAEELLEKIKEYKPLSKIEEMEEGNLNMIDDVLNNGFGEKKDFGKEVRPSLKVRLLEKKEQAGNDKRTEKEKKRERSYPE